MTGRIQAAYMLAPLVMDLTDKRIPLKIVSLGHRSGAVIMVRTDSANKSFKDLRGKRIAIPSRFAVDFLFLRKMLAREGMSPKDIQIIEMPPPDMLKPRCTPRRSTPTAPASRSAPPPSVLALRAPPVHDARRMAQLHLLRADRARRADQHQPPAGAGPGEPRAGG
ncbi:ABC transporter substrate-binding protein [Massilia sp. H-1]|nr:ABC transporter substrate-binding protein [Massilia sp. H-1]